MNLPEYSSVEAITRELQCAWDGDDAGRAQSRRQQIAARISAANIVRLLSECSFAECAFGFSDTQVTTATGKHSLQMHPVIYEATREAELQCKGAAYQWPWLFVLLPLLPNKSEVPQTLVAMLLLSESRFGAALAFGICKTMKPNVLRMLVKCAFGKDTDPVLFVIAPRERNRATVPLVQDKAKCALQSLLVRMPAFAVAALCPDCPPSLYEGLGDTIRRLPQSELPNTLPPAYLLPFLLFNDTTKHFERLVCVNHSAFAVTQALLAQSNAFYAGCSEFYKQSAQMQLSPKSHLLRLMYLSHVIKVFGCSSVGQIRFDFGIYADEVNALFVRDPQQHFSHCVQYLATFYKNGRTMNTTGDDGRHFFNAQARAHEVLECAVGLVTVRPEFGFSWVPNMINCLVDWAQVSDPSVASTVGDLLFKLVRISNNQILSPETSSQLRDIVCLPSRIPQDKIDSLYTLLLSHGLLDSLKRPASPSVKTKSVKMPRGSFFKRPETREMVEKRRQEEQTRQQEEDRQKEEETKVKMRLLQTFMLEAKEKQKKDGLELMLMESEKQILSFDMPADKKKRGILHHHPYNVAPETHFSPSPSDFECVVLCWDVLSNSDVPEYLFLPVQHCYGPVKDAYADFETYFYTFQPLLFAETWQQLQHAKAEKGIISQPDNSHVSVQSVNVSTLGQIKAIDYSEKDRKLLIIHFNPSVLKPLSLTEWDILTIERIYRDNEKPAGGSRLVLGRIVSVNYVDKYEEVRVKVAFEARRLQENTLVAVRSLCSFVTSFRDYSALCNVDNTPFAKSVFSPDLWVPPEIDFDEYRSVEMDYGLNRSQAIATCKACRTDKGQIFLVQGPPGTGKTKTIVAIVSRLLACKMRVLVCAPSNAAVDELTRRLLSLSTSIVRIGALDAIHQDIRHVTLDALVDASVKDTITTALANVSIMDIELAREKERRRQIQMQIDQANGDRIHLLELEKEKITSTIDNLRKNRKEPSKAIEGIRNQERQRILRTANIIAATLAGSGQEQLVKGKQFDFVIIDEAAQCVETNSIVPLRLANCCVLVGDPNQLPPTVLSVFAKDLKFDQSLFDRLYRARSNSVALLDVQYRMHPDISALPSALFYCNRVRNGTDAASRSAPWHDEMFGPLRFFSCKNSVESLHPTTKSFSNIVEVNCTIWLIDQLLSKFPRENFYNKIGIITPYKQQVALLRMVTAKVFGPDCLQSLEINSIDGFQGQEKDIVIFSCVRSGEAIGFLKDKRRMNVALTRARYSLWIIGAVDVLEQHLYWSDLVSHCRRNNVIRSLTSVANVRRYVRTNLLE